VLCGALLYVAGGAALTAYCLQRNAHNDDAVIAREETPAPPESPPAPLPLPSRREHSTVAVSAAEQRRIDKAIVKGVWYLKNRADRTGTWGDGVPRIKLAGVSVAFSALPALTLLECGVPESDPIVQRAAGFVRNQAPTLRNAHETYQLSLAILFLDRLGNPQDRELIQYLALRLIAAQRRDHGWGYHCPVLDRKATKKLLGLLRDNKQTLDRWRNEALRQVEFPAEGSDNSNTQFAILALWVAHRHDVPIERTIERVEKRFSTSQINGAKDREGPDADGSWPYKGSQRHSSKWPTMTCSGLLGLAIAQGLAAEGKEKAEALKKHSGRIDRGLAMLARSIDRPNENRKMDLYFLWSLERVGVLYNLEKIKGKDWYAWGRKQLLERQQGDGSWKDGQYWGFHPILDTCFSLLFLEQANLAADLTDKLRLLAQK
jgi:hypothetical protein